MPGDFDGAPYWESGDPQNDIPEGFVRVTFETKDWREWMVVSRRGLEGPKNVPLYQLARMFLQCARKQVRFHRQLLTGNWVAPPDYTPSSDPQPYRGRPV